MTDEKSMAELLDAVHQHVDMTRMPQLMTWLRRATEILSELEE